MLTLTAEKKTALVKLWSQLPEVDWVILFGSRASGQARPDSDWDFAFMLDMEQWRQKERFSWLAWEEDRIAEASHVVGAANIDIVILNEAPLPLRFYAYRDGVILWERNPEQRIDDQVYVSCRFQDSQHLYKPHLTTLFKPSSSEGEQSW